MANMELVTSHQGKAHITVDQVRELFAGLSGDLSGIKIFTNLDDAMNYKITDVLQIEIAQGQGLAGGFFFQLVDKYTWNLDPGTVGYSRIDMLYLVIYEDPLTNIQSVDLVYIAGLDYPNGGSGVVPDTPAGTNIREAFPLYRADVKDGSILSVTSYGMTYLNNAELETTVAELVDKLLEDVGGTVDKVNENTDALNGFRFGIDNNGNYGYYKAGADSVTPFRNPKGNAVAGDVLSGKTFANASNDEITGTMENRGAWTGTGTPSGNNQINVAIPVGYHNGNGFVTCKGQTAYNAGITQAQNITWVQVLMHTFNVNALRMCLPTKNVRSVRIQFDSFDYTLSYANNANYSTSAPGTELDNDDTTIYPTSNFLTIGVPSGGTAGAPATITVTYQAKILR